MACPPRELFQMGWICALPIEAAAAMEMLDENFGPLDSQDKTDPNAYTLGRIGQHFVVVACLPVGQYGNTSATMVANNMLRTFSKSLRVGFMVGVGGGIPSTAHDIRLGDVVISCPEGTIGGVVQYDMGKVGVGGNFHRTGSLNSPPRSLLTAVNLIRAADLRDDPRFLEYLTSAIGRTTRTRKTFCQPNKEQDRLFKPEYDHPATADSCDNCLADWEETRSERENSDPQPHYGIIASGNSVIKHAWTREQLRLDTGALCFEMEAAGLMLDFPCIVIRGICDYADSHKNQQWQGYAALVAASYAKELLGYIPVGRVSQENLAATTCDGLKEEIQATNQRLDRVYEQHEQLYHDQVTRALTEQQQYCHQVFKVSNYTEQKDINPPRAEGTCQWALQSHEYIRWHKSCFNDLLWISADPGCGKSVLAKSIVDDALEAPSLVTTCYFFFKDNDQQNGLAIALCSILHQLFSQRPNLLHHALAPWEKNGEKLRQEVDELWRILLTAVSANTSCKTICILDALDECREADQGWLIEKFKSFHQQKFSSSQNGCLKFLITSRLYGHLQHSFRGITDFFPLLHLKGEEENDQIHEEIDLVVKLKVKELAEAAQIPWHLQQRLELQLLQMEHRTYLWLHLAIDDIRITYEESLRPDEESIPLVPPSVNAAYEKILSRVPSRQVVTAKKIFQLIVAARRPLTIGEMAMALGIATFPQAQTIAQAGLDPFQLERKLRQLCGLFVFTKNSKIFLIHQTAREFFIRQEFAPHLSNAYSCSTRVIEKQMAHICLQYLLMLDLEHDEGQTNSTSRNLLEYFAIYWPDHVRKLDLISDQEIINHAHRLYATDIKRQTMWFPKFWSTIRPYENPPKMHAIHLAAFNGHEREIYVQLDLGRSNVNLSDSTGAYPIIWASLNGHDKTVQALFEGGADVNAQGGQYGNALFAACSEGHDKVVQVLLKCGADLNTQGGDYGNALYAGCFKGNDKIVQLLLEAGADVNAQSGYYGNALQAACFKGHGKIVQLLLEAGADVNAQGGYYGNSLFAACSEGNGNIVQVLLEGGADVNAQGRHYSNALFAACSEGNDKIVQVLLEAGADVNAQGPHFGNSLQVASFKGHEKVVQVLLKGGANANSQGGFYGNALQAACFTGDEKIVHVLLESGANAEARGGHYGTSLQTACFKGHDTIVQVLLESGADVNAQVGDYGNSLQAACFKGYDKVVKVLLEGGANVNAQGGRFGNAIYAACSGGHSKIVRMLTSELSVIQSPSHNYPSKRVKVS